MGNQTTRRRRRYAGRRLCVVRGRKHGDMYKVLLVD